MDALDLLFALRLENGETWGSVAAPFQLDQAHAILKPGNGPRRHWDGRPRGSSKTADVGGMLLAELATGAIPVGQPAYGAAADRAQAGLLLDSLRGYVERSALESLIEVQTFRAIHRNSGASIEILAADASGSYGLRPSRLSVDELCQWPDTRGARRFFEALWTSLPKVRDSIGVITTTAGTPGHWSHAVYQRALSETKLWRVNMVNTAAPWIDPELIEAERRALTDSAFLRLWCNEWAQAEDALVSGDDLEAAAVLDGPVAPVEGVKYVITVDVGTVHDRTVVVVAHKEGTGEDERVICDRLWRWQGSRRNPVSLEDVEATIVEAHAHYPGPITADPYQAVHLLQRLNKRGVAASKIDFTTQSVGRFAMSLLQLLRARRLSLPNDPVLLEELANVRIRENSAGVARLDHPSGGRDDQAVALALACYRLTDGAPTTHHARMRLSRSLRDGHGAVVGLRGEDAAFTNGAVSVHASWMPPPDEVARIPEPAMPESRPGRIVINLGSVQPEQPPPRRERVVASEPEYFMRHRNADRGPAPSPEIMAQVARFGRLARRPTRRKEPR